MTRTSSPSGGESSARSHSDQAAPLLRVLSGEPSAEELAALTVVVAALSQRRARPRRTPVGAWTSYADGHRRPLLPGHGGWRASGRLA
ncbi:MAG: hypothetical protein JWQ99_1830 [Blastococcus sp.]|jgi:hypothetical protein|nr:hypothetical protein [Blastococcus sp.]